MPDPSNQCGDQAGPGAIVPVGRLAAGPPAPPACVDRSSRSMHLPIRCAASSLEKAIIDLCICGGSTRYIVGQEESNAVYRCVCTREASIEPPPKDQDRLWAAGCGWSTDPVGGPHVRLSNDSRRGGAPSEGVWIDR